MVATFSESAAGEVSLNGVSCKACGFLAFPHQSYGCERCGASGEALSERPLSPHGRLNAFASVHLHFGKDIEAPFIIGTITLDDGPTVRCTLMDRDETHLSHGDKVVAKVFVNDRPDPDNPKREIRFEREG